MVAPSKDPNLLAEPLRSIVIDGIAEAKRTGRSLSLNSGRRSISEQIRLRRQNCGTTRWAIYSMPSGKCSPPTAKPGASKHQTGQAADMSGAKDWFYERYKSRGLIRPVRGEDWHFEVSGQVPVQSDPSRPILGVPGAPGTGGTVGEFQVGRNALKRTGLGLIGGVLVLVGGTLIVKQQIKLG